ncbi:glycosyltransferase family 2 protein [Anaerolineales bacterium HSG6]|nr:glycosyltransferase family 2 protein [Anaerolineales bacterium HSG6]MDM8530928.1 glycosyltransferase family 2 protein [Anaerolineales bacterium HSG25]
MSNFRYSIVAPCYNEEENLNELYRRITEVMEQTQESWELVLVNDGSADRTLDLMIDLHAQDSRVHYINFARNFGHQIAVTAGMDYAQGEAIVLIDADLQDPPELILEMIKKWRDGYMVIYAKRSERKGETWFKIWTAKLFYRIIYSITDIHIPLDTGDFRLMDRKVVDTMKHMPERNRFIRGMTSWVGFKQTGVEYVREERFAGETNYPFRRMLKFAVTAITGFSHVPLQMAMVLGFFVAVLSVISILAVTIARFFGGEAIFGGQATTLVTVLFLGGVQLISLGIIGEYLGRIYDEVKARPMYVVHKAVGFENTPE